MRYLHTMVRVRDLDASLHFYCDLLGLQEVRRTENEAARFTLIFLAAPKNLEQSAAERSPELELTYNWDQSAYQRGTAYGHIALAVHSVAKSCASLQAAGVSVVREAGPMQSLSPDRTSAENIAFIEDPDGYQIELIERR